MLRRIVYSSQAVDGVGIRDAYDIIRTAHNRNSQAGITGGLILIDGYFFQLMEGLPKAVEERFARIETDPRHTHIQVRQDTTVESAIFESDWMALRDGAIVSKEVLQEHHYAIGMPPNEYSAQQLLDFMLACFEKELVRS